MIAIVNTKFEKRKLPKKKLMFSTSLFLASNLLTGIFAFLISFFLTAHFVAGVEVAQGVTPTLSTSSIISNGAIDPIIYMNSTNFASDVYKLVFTVEVGTTGLTYASAAFVNSTRVRLNFRGTAHVGEISVQAAKSAFMPIAGRQSNTLTITVPDP